MLAANRRTAEPQNRRRGRILVFGFGTMRRKLRKVVDETARDIFSTEPFELIQVDESKGWFSPSVNLLEFFAARVFCFERVCYSVIEPEELQRQVKEVGCLLIVELSEEYSKDEMNEFVMPLLDKRIPTYHAALDSQGSPGERLYRCFGGMIDHFCAGELEVDQKGLFAIELSKRMMVDPGKRLKEALANI